jgi:predicted solute-binding protein
MTGLPFVFAVWSYRRDHPDGSKITQLLVTAKQAGCSAIDGLGEMYASKLGITTKRCCQYLTNCIHYDVGTQELAGMELFRNLSQNLKKGARIPIHEMNNLRLRNITDVKPEHHYEQT